MSARSLDWVGTFEQYEFAFETHKKINTRNTFRFPIIEQSTYEAFLSSEDVLYNPFQHGSWAYLNLDACSAVWTGDIRRFLLEEAHHSRMTSFEVTHSDTRKIWDI